MNVQLIRLVIFRLFLTLNGVVVHERFAPGRFIQNHLLDRLLAAGTIADDVTAEIDDVLQI